MFHCDLWLTANAVFRKSTKTMFLTVNWVYRKNESKEGSTCSLGDGVPWEGRLLWFLLLTTHSVLVAEVTPAWEAAQLSAHSSCCPASPVCSTESREVTKAMRWCRVPASSRGCPFLPAAEAPSHMLIWLLILPDAKPIQFTELAENKYRNK